MMISSLFTTLNSSLGSGLAMLAPDAGDGHAAASAHLEHLVSHVGTGPKWILLVPFLPMLGFVLNAIYAAMGIKTKLPAWTTVLLLAIAFVATLNMFLSYDGTPYTVQAFEWFNLHYGEKSFVANFSFYVDKLTILWMLFVTGLATLIALYASEYMSHDLGAASSWCRCPAWSWATTSSCSTWAGRAWACVRTCSSGTSTRSPPLSLLPRRRSSSTASVTSGWHWVST